MRRWNGWGDDTITYPVPARAVASLQSLAGPSHPLQDAPLASVVRSVPQSRLFSHPLLSLDPLQRLLHARGQSLPDWIALRSGRIPAFPDAVAYPSSAHDVQTLLRHAAEVGARLIPYGGGTSVAGHINTRPSEPPAIAVDLSRISRLSRFDQASQLATFGAGVTGPDLEAQLRARGYTLGHYPQSFEYSTLGGWIATRSSGQQSRGYGRIEDLFAGGSVETPAGSLVLPPFPASAAGPDLRHLVLGSEGRLGILVEATVRVTPLPEREEFHAVFLPDWEQGMAAAQALAHSRLPLSLLRLSTPVETQTTLALAGHRRLISTMERLLSLRQVGEDKCMLMVGFTGTDQLVTLARKATFAITATYGGVTMGRSFGAQWHKSRFRTPYLRNTLWEMGYAVDTLETATTWSGVAALVQSLENALVEAMARFDEHIHVFTHLSHLYPSGSSVYTTCLFRLAEDPETTLHRWQALKTAASETIVAGGGTISHQHGVGTDHAPYLAAEKGDLGMAILQAAIGQLDPAQIMNPGKLIGAADRRWT